MTAEVSEKRVSHEGPFRSLLAKKLQGYDAISDEEVRILEQSIAGTRSFDAESDLVSFGDRPTYSSLIIEGWAARYKTLENGARQITALHVPGDFVDLHSFLLHPMDHGVVALSACRIATVPHDRLRHITETQPHLTRVLWLNTLIDAALHREWLVFMGRTPAVNQLAHLICELYQRLDAVGLIKDNTFELPLTQTALGDTLGLSAVHVNRTLQEIRARQLLSWQGKTVQIFDWEGLKSFAQFDPAYLHQVRQPL